MNINTLRYSLFGIAGGQEVDHTFVKFIVYPLTMVAFNYTVANANHIKLEKRNIVTHKLL